MDILKEDFYYLGEKNRAFYLSWIGKEEKKYKSVDYQRKDKPRESFFEGFSPLSTNTGANMNRKSLKKCQSLK